MQSLACNIVFSLLLIKPFEAAGLAFASTLSGFILLAIAMIGMALGLENIASNEISKSLKEFEAFNPSMLYFSLLALWFKELNKESRSKEYIYFILYPYSHVYDRLLVGMKNKEFKELNIKMIELAEKIIYKFDDYILK